MRRRGRGGSGKARRRVFSGRLFRRRSIWSKYASAIGRAEKTLGAGRVQFIHPDCGFWMVKRSVADRKIAVLAKGRDLYLGRA